MTNQVKAKLSTVRRRQQMSFAAQSAAMGLLIGAGVMLATGLIRLFGGEISWVAAVAGPIAGLTGGAVFGLIVPVRWGKAAEAIDTHYRLKDRAATALEFAARNETGDLHQLQIEDAITHLSDVDANKVAPLQMPRVLPAAVAMSLFAGLLYFIPLVNAQEELAEAPNENIIRATKMVEEDILEDLEEMAEELKEDELEELVDELKDLLEEMKEEDVDQHKALAKLSKMESAIKAAMAEFNLEAKDAQFEKLGEAMEMAASMKAASKALKDGEYAKAAEEFEKMDAETFKDLTKREKKALAGKLKKLAKDMEAANQGELSEATEELAEGIENESKAGQCKSGACKLAGQCKKQGLRKGACKGMGSKLSALAMCKGQCRGNKSGPSQKVAKSNSPKNTWGTGASAKPLGAQATNIDSQRNMEKIQGQHGDGPSEKEVAHSPDGREEATRGYKESYADFKRKTEALLEQEPLPIGYQQTIRKYFELIRPESSAASEEAEE